MGMNFSYWKPMGIDEFQRCKKGKYDMILEYSQSENKVQSVTKYKVPSPLSA